MITYKNERLIEIVGEFKHIQVRDQEIVLDDGVEIGRKPFVRKTIGPTDSTTCPECQALKDLYHTTDLIEEYTSYLSNLQNPSNS